MLNLRRQNQRFETLIQNAVYRGTVYAHFFAFATLTQEGRSNYRARAFSEFCIQAASCSCT